MNYKIIIKEGEKKALWGGSDIINSNSVDCLIVFRIDSMDEPIKIQTLNKNNGQSEVFDYGTLKPDETFSITTSQITAIIAEASNGDTAVDCTIMKN